MIETICSWYTTWTLGVLNWYTAHPVIFAISVVGSMAISLFIAVVGIYYGIKYVAPYLAE